MNIRALFDDDYEEYDIIEAIRDSDVVWRDADTEVHRWYILQDVVVEYEGNYIKYNKYIITGDNSMSDMDLEYSLEDFTVVQKKERTVIETYYGS